eukprot:NODE_871_length_3383_cov_0.938794.p5 type:complete len:103 gc:universal NODE_871_length_3383_cov_0.938794:3009-2701(-)
MHNFKLSLDSFLVLLSILKFHVLILRYELKKLLPQLLLLCLDNSLMAWIPTEFSHVLVQLTNISPHLGYLLLRTIAPLLKFPVRLRLRICIQRTLMYPFKRR